MRKTGCGVRTSVLVVSLCCCAVVGAQVRLPSNAPALDRAGLMSVGHEPIAPDPTIRRYTGMIAALGAPDAQGKVYSFKPSPVGPRNFPLSPGDLRGWRMTMLSGKHFAEVFRVSGNTESEITVNRDKGPIGGLEVGDLFIIESIDDNGASMFGPAIGAPASPGSGI